MPDSSLVPAAPPEPSRSRGRRVLAWTGRGAKFSLKLLGRALVIAYFVLALCFLILRYGLAPQVQSYREDVESVLSASLGLNVQVDGIQANWDGLHPQLSMRGVRVYDAQGQVGLNLPNIEASVAVWSSLWNWRLELKQLDIGSPDLTIRRAKNGDLFVAGLLVYTQKSEDSSSSGFGDFVLQQKRIHIQDAKLVWIDQMREREPLALSRVSFLLINSREGWLHQFALKAVERSTYTAQLDIRGDVVGRDLNDPDSWRGSLYARLDQADFAHWKNWIDYHFELEQGLGGMQGWFDFQGRTTLTSTVDVALSDVRAHLASDLPLLDLVSLSGRIHATRTLAPPAADGSVDQTSGAFTLSGENLQLALRDGVHIAPTQFSLSHHFQEGVGEESLLGRNEFSSSQFDIRALAQVGAYLPMPKAWRAQLAEANPKGIVKNFALAWQMARFADGTEGASSFKLDTEFENLSLCAQSKTAQTPCERAPRSQSAAFAYNVPGLQGLSGEIHGTEQNGSFDVSVSKGSLDLPDVMSTPTMALTQASMQGEWGREKSDENKLGALSVRLKNLSLLNDDLDASFQGVWQAKADSAGELDFTGDIKQAKLASVWRYLPLVTSQSAVDWLKRGLPRGTAHSATFVAKGPAGDFPFRGGKTGLFRVQGKLREVDVDFAPGWPALVNIGGEFLFEGTRMLISTQGGSYFPRAEGAVRLAQNEVKFDPVTVEIPDLDAHGKEVLTVDGRARGKSASMLDYVNHSDVLVKNIGSFTKGVSAQGNGVLDLHVRVPLSHGNDTTVKGAFHFTDNQLGLIPHFPLLYGATGTLTFTEKDVALPQARATFLNAPVEAVGATQEDGTLRFDVKGVLPIKQIDQLFHNPVWTYLEGQSATKASIVIRKHLVDIAASSDLVGVSTSLPEPLSKAASDVLPLRFGLKINTEHNPNLTQKGGQDWTIDIGERLLAHWQDDCVGSDCHFARGALSFKASNQMREGGLAVTGDFERFNAWRWRPILDEVIPNNSGSSNVAAREPFTVSVNAHANAMVSTTGHVFYDLDVKALAKEDVWRFDLTSPDIAGELKISSGKEGEQVFSRLSRLTLHEASPSETPALASKEGMRLPDLDIEAEQFSFRGTELGALKLKASNCPQGWCIEQFSTQSPNASVNAQGLWREEDSRTALAFDLDIHHVGDWLDQMRYSGIIQGGQAKLTGNLAWKGLPTQMTLSALEGDVALSAANGVFVEIDPGAAKFLGVFNIKSLPRRAVTGFNDLISDGLAFDTIKGEVTLEEGVMQIGQLQINSPAAKIGVLGQVDLVKQQQRLDVRIQPTLSESVAIGSAAVGAIAGAFNPLVGLAVYAGQKVLRDPVEKIFAQEYSVKGTWEKPEIGKKTQETYSTSVE